MAASPNVFHPGALNVLEEILLRHASVKESDISLQPFEEDGEYEAIGLADDCLRRLWIVIIQAQGRYQELGERRELLLEEQGTLQRSSSRAKALLKRIRRLDFLLDQESDCGMILQYWWNVEILRRFPEVCGRECLLDERWFVLAALAPAASQKALPEARSGMLVRVLH